MVRFVLQLHKDEMQARTKPSTSPHFVKGDKQGVSCQSKLFTWTAHQQETQRQITWTFFSGGANWETQLHVKPYAYILCSNLRPCSATPLRPAVPVTVPEGDDEEFDFSHIFDVCIKSLHGRRGKCLFFMKHFSDDDIPHVSHRLNEVHRTAALRDFSETPQWHNFAQSRAYIDFMHAHPTRIPESQ
jgi:hypothetical protein